MRAMRFMLCGWVVAAHAALSGPALAKPTGVELSAWFMRGDYIEAAAAAESQSGPDMLAFAARSLLAEVMTAGGTPDQNLVDRAMRDAEAALAMDHRHEEARLQLAIALSLKGRDMPLLDAWKAGYGQRARSLAESVLADDPDNYYAHGLLAVWHVEVRRRGGSMGAAMMGASVEAGREHYERAAALAPEDAGVHWAYARALAAYDAKGRRQEIGRALAAAARAKPASHVDEVMKTRAALLTETLARDARAAERMAKELL
jgi:hypothetical protein